MKRRSSPPPRHLTPVSCVFPFGCSSSGPCEPPKHHTSGDCEGDQQQAGRRVSPPSPEPEFLPVMGESEGAPPPRNPPRGHWDPCAVVWLQTTTLSCRLPWGPCVGKGLIPADSAIPCSSLPCALGVHLKCRGTLVSSQLERASRLLHPSLLHPSSSSAARCASRASLRPVHGCQHDNGANTPVLWTVPEQPCSWYTSTAGGMSHVLRDHLCSLSEGPGDLYVFKLQAPSLAGKQWVSQCKAPAGGQKVDRAPPLPPQPHLSLPLAALVVAGLLWP